MTEIEELKLMYHKLLGGISLIASSLGDLKIELHEKGLVKMSPEAEEYTRKTIELIDDELGLRKGKK